MEIQEISLKNRVQAAALLRDLECDATGIRIMESKAIFRTVRICGIRSKAANLLKQTFLGKGGDVALGRGAADLSVEYTDALIIGTDAQYRRAVAQLKLQPWGLKEVAAQLEMILCRDGRLPMREYRWQDRALLLDGMHSKVMGILNVTPDSFSDGGKYNDLESAIRRVEAMQAEGADIIDIGAESTRPYGGAEQVTAEREMERLLPMLEKILPHCSVPVSVDTYKSEVAEAALRCGAHIINDIWGLQGDPEMARVAAQYDVPVIVMHNRKDFLHSGDIMQEIWQFLQKSIQTGIEKGVKSENIIIDPGIGFAKTFAHNMEIMRRLEELQTLDCPLLLGASRKRFIGEALDAPVGERTEGTIAAAALGKVKGAQIHRVHDVQAVKRALKMMDAMMEEEWKK